MFKLVVLSALLAVAAAAPSGLPLAGSLALSSPLLSKTILAQPTLVKSAVIAEPGHVSISQPVIARVGDIVQSVPTAVSHQSSTVVHNRANIVTPIVAPAVKTITTPVLNTYAAHGLVSAPTLLSAPLVKTIDTPLLKTIDAPFAYSGLSGTYAGLPGTYAGLSGAYSGSTLIKTVPGSIAYSAPLAHGW